MSTSYRFFPILAARTLALGVALTLCALAAASPARAQAAWCAQYLIGGTNCGFYTQKQCREALSGIGGTCSRNPWAAQNQTQRRKARNPYGYQWR